MTFTDFLSSRNWSRKAQIVLLTIAGIVWVCQINDLPGDAKVYASLMILGIGALGVVAQTVLDWKHPKRESLEREPDTSFLAVEAITNGLQPGGHLREFLTKRGWTITGPTGPPA